MPAVQPPAKVLVSGATGYIAAWVVRDLLERGYAVRGTARSVAKGDFLKKAFASYGDRFEVVGVEDIAQDGAFDEAVKGMDAIEHTASPFHLNAVDPDELIKPGINGTVGILKSILKDESTKVKRVVITSSGAAVFRHNPNPTTFTEADWNNQYGLEILEKYEDEGRKNEGPNMEKYRASKTLAERSAWDFVNSPENKPRINYSQVFGANHTLKSPRQLLNTSAALFYNYVAYGAKAAGNDFLANTGVCWTNVRDVAEAHALALEKETAGGERIIVSAGL